jgi:hypothetical protein
VIKVPVRPESENSLDILDSAGRSVCKAFDLGIRDEIIAAINERETLASTLNGAHEILQVCADDHDGLQSEHLQQFIRGVGKTLEALDKSKGR